MKTEEKWEVKDNKLYAFTIESSTKTIALIPINGEAEEIARLIAAAPKTKQQKDNLLTVCKRIKERIDTDGLISGDTTGLYTCIKQVIAECKGE